MLEKLKRIWKKVADSADPQALAIPGGMPGGPTGISIEGRCYIEVDGCKGLSDYEEHLVCVRIKEGLLRIQGENLSLKIYYGTRIAVCGRICALSFEEGDDQG